MKNSTSSGLEPATMAKWLLLKNEVLNIAFVTGYGSFSSEG
jgi:hypothetical protein